jgi:hypothetical protein
MYARLEEHILSCKLHSPGSAQFKPATTSPALPGETFECDTCSMPPVARPSRQATATCRRVNVPTVLLAALHSSAQRSAAARAPPLLIHISTDQVYDGKSPLSTEMALAKPVNVYGATKLEAEQTIQARWPQHVILRSSIIYGPQPCTPISRPLFVQFIVRYCLLCAHSRGHTHVRTSIVSSLLWWCERHNKFIPIRHARRWHAVCLVHIRQRQHRCSRRRPESLVPEQPLGNRRLESVFGCPWGGKRCERVQPACSRCSSGSDKGGLSVQACIGVVARVTERGILLSFLSFSLRGIR